MHIFNIDNVNPLEDEMTNPQPPKPILFVNCDGGVRGIGAPFQLVSAGVQTEDLLGDLLNSSPKPLGDQFAVGQPKHTPRTPKACTLNESMLERLCIKHAQRKVFEGLKVGPPKMETYLLNPKP